MSLALDKACLAQGAIAAADATGLTGVFRILLTGGAQSWAVPTALRGKWLRLEVFSSDHVQYAFGLGAAAPTINANEISVLGTGDVNAGATIWSKSTDEVIVPPLATFLAFRSVADAGTNGTLAGWFAGYCKESLSA